MTDDKAYWSRLEELARAEAAAALGDKKPGTPTLLDRILAAAPPPAGISPDDAKKRARDVVMDVLRRAFPGCNRARDNGGARGAV